MLSPPTPPLSPTPHRSNHVYAGASAHYVRTYTVFLFYCFTILREHNNRSSRDFRAVRYKAACLTRRHRLVAIIILLFRIRSKVCNIAPFRRAGHNSTVAETVPPVPKSLFSSSRLVKDPVVSVNRSRRCRSSYQYNLPSYCPPFD